MSRTTAFFLSLERFISDFDREISPDTAVNLSPLLSEEDVLRMNEHINQLDQIRMDPDFRMVFLFQRVPPSHFLDLLSTHEPEMLRFLSDLEEVAVQLDKMNKGAKISSVVGSSAAAIGGLLTIGLALTPVTAGASVALSVIGLVLEGGIGATNAITNLTGIWVNYQNLDKAQKAFKSFVTCMQEIQSCLKEASSQTGTEVQTSTNDVLMELDGADLSMGGVRKNVESLIDNVKEVEAGLSLASDLPDVSQAVVEGTLTLFSEAFSLGFDVFSVCKNGKDLAKGTETIISKFIRARAALWRSEMDSWRKMQDSLSNGLPTAQEKKEILEASFISDFDREISPDTAVNLSLLLMDPDFRMVFLFQKVSPSHFMDLLSTHEPEMLRFLSDLEEVAVNLDKMNKGAKISSVVGSSVGAIGSILSIIGLALIPVTAGASVALSISGLVLGVASGTNSAITTLTGTLVNKQNQNEGQKAFESFVRCMQKIQSCLEEARSQTGTEVQTSTNDVLMELGQAALSMGGVGKTIDSLIDNVSSLKALKMEGAGGAAAKEVESGSKFCGLASDLPDVGQAATKGPLALSKGARAGLITLNALFLGLDVFFICKDGKDLAKGTETIISKFIRARAALWRSEMDSWRRMQDSLSNGLPTAQEKKEILEASFNRQNLKEALCCYVLYTAMYTDTVRSFLEILPEWTLAREIEMLLLVDIKDRLDKLSFKLSNITESKAKGKALKDSVINFIKKDSKLGELEGELAAVLRNTPAGLEQLDGVLDAVEKLAATSKHVFTRNQILHLSNETHLDTIQAIITAARHASPLLLEFKRDAKAFFQPKLPNLEVLSYQLDRYVKTTNMICEKLPRRLIGDFDREISPDTAVNLSPLLSEEDVLRMNEHINQLDQIRMDPDFRMVFLFQRVPPSHFMDLLSTHEPEMLRFLSDLEEVAVKLDKMNKGAKISSVVGSSRGHLGLVLGVASGTNSAITNLTGTLVNKQNQYKGQKAFESFVRCMQKIQSCLEEARSQTGTEVQTSTNDVVMGLGQAALSVGCVGKKIDSLIDNVSSLKALKIGAAGGAAGAAAKEVKAGSRFSRLASDLPDVGQAAAKGPLALSKGARAGLITLNALFLGLDVFFICKDGKDLAKGTETIISKFIRARAALWCSEMDSWRKMQDSLSKGLPTAQEKKEILEASFYIKLKEALCRYVSNTAMYIDTVRSFLEILPEWTLAREKEINHMVNIIDRLDKLSFKLSNITESQAKGKALKDSVINFIKKDSKLAELEGELAAVLREALGGLEQLDGFLDAVEKLAVTSEHVFTRNRILHLSNETHLDTIQAIITAARHVSPLLLEFKRDAKAFFQPKLPNLEVLSYQLDRYVKTTNTICEKLPRRMDPDFRIVFLFQKVPPSHFMGLLSTHEPEMLRFLSDLEEVAVKLEIINKGAKISSVTGSLAGAIGSILSIVGLALIPVTAGVSVALSVSKSVLEGATNAITNLTETWVNNQNLDEAQKAFQSFEKCMQKIQCCLEEARSQTGTEVLTSTNDVLMGLGGADLSVGDVRKTIRSLTDKVSSSKAGGDAPKKIEAGSRFSRLASDIQDVGQAAAKGPLALSKEESITLNALFLGLNVFFIYKNGKDLATGTETIISKFIRARAALLRSGMDSWRRIQDSLSKGLPTAQKKKEILEASGISPDTAVNLSPLLSEGKVWRMLEHINQLDEIRMDPNFRMELDCFLDAAETLAVTSLHVFTKNQLLILPQEIGLDYVQAVITAARSVCPLILEFKREAKAFFSPKLQNVEVLAHLLDKYIQTSKNICEKMDKSCLTDFSLKTSEPAVEICVDMSDDDIQRMLDHLEESAVQRDRMNKGAKISSVAGSSVGAVGGVLSIVGLALIPVTAGVSLALTMTGVGLGVTSKVNSVVTTATEMGVNLTQQKKANEVFQSFMEDVARIQDCLGEVSRQMVAKMETDGIEVAVGVGKILRNSVTIGRGINKLVDMASAAKLLNAEKAIASEGKVLAQEGKALRNNPRVASEIPDVGSAVAKGPLALGKGARAGFIALNALFLGMDIFFICKDSISLARGSETETSQFIRARAALWSSEIDSWKKIHDCLDEGLKTSAKKKAVLETPFYPDT
ncbi:unnamed protein product [Menidia menidia]|uniref:(Atlantic silverside) hypothetical protein n=1 Tax=Menidia menidia TaxID=238744 RepID=A0A8S4AWE4_9TELE|nr:unnamed protein product [Menidia menidia]